MLWFDDPLTRALFAPDRLAQAAVVIARDIIDTGLVKFDIPGSLSSVFKVLDRVSVGQNALVSYALFFVLFLIVLLDCASPHLPPCCVYFRT